MLKVLVILFTFLLLLTYLIYNCCDDKIGGSCNSDEFLSSPEVIVRLHYVDWCGYCKEVKPKWEQIKENLANTAVKIEEVNEETDKKPRPLDYPVIAGYPTIIKIDKRGGKPKYLVYRGVREIPELTKWILKN